MKRKILTAEASNFKKSVVPVTLAAEAPRDVDIHLTPGGSSETVTVEGNDVPLLQTADASIGSTVSSNEITRLPAFGRDPYELLRTAVGTNGDGARNGTGGGVFLPNGQGPGQSNYGVFQTENQVQISASGQRVTSNTYLIDGVSVDSLIHGGSAIITPNPESVSQITITSSSYDASEGRNVGAQIKTVTKSGTNTYHGSLFFQYDEPGLNAYQYFGGPTSTPGSYALPQRVNNKQREYAASIGGPVLKDKLFGKHLRGSRYPDQNHWIRPSKIVCLDCHRVRTPVACLSSLRACSSRTVSKTHASGVKRGAQALPFVGLNVC